MKIFIAKDENDTPEHIQEIVRHIKNTPKPRKIYLFGEDGVDWDLVVAYNLDGLSYSEALCERLKQDK